VLHRANRYLNNHLEQAYRGSKQRYRSMGGLKHGYTAARFCLAFDEVRAFLRPLMLPTKTPLLGCVSSFRWSVKYEPSRRPPV
jgi:hypothetical protein